ncbi:MAG: FMN-dependent NADH-azoreductase [Clostridiales bacterium]
MKKLLYINGNPQSEDLSFSKRVGNYYLKYLHENDDNLDVSIFNIYEEYVPLIDEDVLGAWRELGSGTNFNDLSKNQQNKVARMNEILEMFKNTDEYVIVTPLWNFGIPPMLKAFIDNIVIAGKTFKYTETGPVGLIEGKKALLIQASGGYYSSGPTASMEHGSNYLKTILGFVGIADVKTLLLEGVAVPGKSSEDKLKAFYKQVDGIFEAK